MYVDKKLHGVDCVQTLSRLNRTFPGKETFILDFFNDPQDILKEFLPYYNKAELANVSDPQLIYDLQNKLDAESIYHWGEVTAFAIAFFDPKAAASKLSYHCKPGADGSPSATKPPTHTAKPPRVVDTVLDAMTDHEKVSRNV